MRRLRNCTLALLIGLCTPLLIWMGAGSALYGSMRRARLLKRALPDLTCAIDADCPSGFVCLGGRCVSGHAL